MKYFLLTVLLLNAAIAGAQPKIGKPAPALCVQGPATQPVDLSAYRGKVVLVDFWASWCRPCRESNRWLAPIYNQYRHKGFEILGISLDQDSSSWQQAIHADGINWIQVNEKGGWRNPVTTEWRVRFLPTSFLIDRKGVIVSIDPGATELRNYLQQALN